MNLMLSGGNGGLRPRSALAAACDMMPRERLILALEDPDLESWFIDSMRAGVRRGDRTAMRIYAEAREVVGQKVDLAVMIVNQIGAPAAAARGAVQAMDRAQGMDEMTILRKSAQRISEWCRANGHEIPEFPAQLTGSGAEVVEVHNGNGAHP